MNRNDFNLIAAVIRQAVTDETARPALAMRFVEAFARRGDQAPHFLIEDFLNRCVPPKQKRELGRIDPGREAPPIRERTVESPEANAALFLAIIATEFPHLRDAIGCQLFPKKPGRFSIGRVGTKVWIRFFSEALLDPVAAVRAAAPDAEAMALGKSSAREILGR